MTIGGRRGPADQRLFSGGNPSERFRSCGVRPTCREKCASLPGRCLLATCVLDESGACAIEFSDSATARAEIGEFFQLGH